MLTALKRSLANLKLGRPGRRFEQHYEWAQQSESRGASRRWINFLLAGITFAIGVVLVFIPGPAVVFFFITGALLAPESRAIARFMDWSEMKIRALWQWAISQWRGLSQAGKIAAASLLAMVGVVGALTFWRILRG
ncbi:MAG: hypothetical protein RIQ93_287 [Verrucomicrobiota bacterium]|jgi:hypothetical protein